MYHTDVLQQLSLKAKHLADDMLTRVKRLPDKADYAAAFEPILKRVLEYGIHEEKRKQVHGNWQQLVPVLNGNAKAFYESGRQCFCCESYIPLEWPLGADWGACSNPNVVDNKKVVFEHHTCLAHKYKKVAP